MTLRIIYVVWAFTLVGVVGCASGSGSSGSGGGAGPGGTSLDAALSRVADTASTRSSISYDNTAELARLPGSNPASTKGFGSLRGWATAYASVASNSGINVLAARYGISAGTPPATLSLVDGGQEASRVTSTLTGGGWKRNNGELVAPPIDATSQLAEEYALSLQQVRASGSDVTFGDARADLSQIGSPSGATLASDPLISSLASCLGNVVAAEFGSGLNLGGRNPAGVAVGVNQPASNSATPHVVACVSWPTQVGAAQYATDVRKALTSGMSIPADRPYSALLPGFSVTVVGGRQHIVEWQASTPGNASLVMEMFLDFGLPALPDCSRLSPSARAQAIGCT